MKLPNLARRLGVWAGSLLAVASLVGCATPAGAWPYLPQHRGSSGGVQGALALVISPSTQRVPRVGAGSVTTTLSYLATGGKPPYTYATSAPGLTITNGATSAPSFSKTLTNGQDSFFSITGTLTDKTGASVQTVANVELVSTAVAPPGLSLAVAPTTQSKSINGPGVASATVTYTPAGGVPPYTYNTVAPGLTVTTATSQSPTVSATLSAGQTGTYTVTGTLRDSVGSTPATANATVTLTSIPLPLSLTAAPASQTQTIQGPGPIAATINYTASGGVPPYTYATSAPGLTVANGATVSPTVSTTLTNGQDSTFQVTGTLTDSASTPAVTATASVRFTSNTTVTAFDPLVPLARGMVADNVAQTQFQWTNGGASKNYALTPKVSYGQIDMTNLGDPAKGGAGFTYFRIPVDVQQILAGLPFPTSYLLGDGTGKWKGLSTTFTATAGNTAGCGVIYISSNCTVSLAFTYLDSVVDLMIQNGFAVDLVPFVAGTFPGSSGGCADAGTCPSGSLHTNMGGGTNCYGFAVMSGATCYETMLQAANVALVNHYAAKYPQAKQVFFELYNEPEYKTVSGTPSYEAPAIWNTALPIITAAIRSAELAAVGSNPHWIISDCPSSGKAQNCSTMTPTADEQTVYSFHKYDPSEFVMQGSGSALNPYLVYPRPSSGEAAIGRPGGIAPAYIPFPKPVFGTPTGYKVTATAGCADATPAAPAGTVTAWAANATTALTAHAEKACVTTVGNNPSTSLVDMYAGNSTSEQVTKSDLYGNIADGIQFAVNWAVAGGHTGPRSGEVLKIIAGEIGVTRSVDYLSADQIVTDLRATLESTSVPGGQSSIPWDWWAFSGVQFGFRPKSTTTALTHWCPYTSGALTGYDQDWYARLKTPIGDPTPHCLGQAGFTTPGL